MEKPKINIGHSCIPERRKDEQKQKIEIDGGVFVCLFLFLIHRDILILNIANKS